MGTERRVPVGDFRVDSEARRAINEMLDRGRITEGEKTREFEIEFAKFVGTKHCITFNSGTSAIIAGLTALAYSEKFGVHPGTKIITSPLTYVATSNAIIKAGFTPVYVDVDPQTFVITPMTIEAHLDAVLNTKDYSMILPVHLMGYPCDMYEVNKVAEKFNLKTVEDSAQAHGTEYHGKKTGSLSLLAAFSFYIAHNIQAGEMGAITTDDAEIARLVRKIKANGRVCECTTCTRATKGCTQLSTDDDHDPRFTHDFIGYNFKVMDFQAILGLSQLKRFGSIFEKRRSNVMYLNERLDQFSDLLQLPVLSEGVSYLAYPIVIKKPDRINRGYLRRELEKYGVETRPLFGCIPTQQPAYHFLQGEYRNKLPIADYIGMNGFYIGCHQYLDREQLNWVVEVFTRIFKEI